MGARRITLTDVCNVTGSSRHRLRNILNELPEFSSRDAKARVANVYSKQDLAVIAVCVELEDRFGLRRDVVASLSAGVREALSGPKVLAKHTCLQIRPWSASVEYSSVTADFQEGLVLPLKAVLERIDIYLLDDQRPLNLSPVSVMPTERVVEPGLAVARAKQGSK